MIGTLRALGAEALGDLEALHVGQHDVEHHEVRVEAAHRRERVAPGARRLDLEALEAQRHRDDVDDVRLVVDDEDAVLLGVGGRGVHADIVGMKPGKLLRARS